MPLKDHTLHYDGLQDVAAPAEVQVENVVSRHIKTGDRAFTQVVGETGYAFTDSELNLVPEVHWMQNYLLRRWHHPSGWLRGQYRKDVYSDYTVETAPTGFNDATGIHIHADNTLLDALILPKLEAVVAGLPVVVEYANTSTAGYNLVTLDEPTGYDGTNATFKRTDFVFLEVWKALVAPSPRASGSVQVVSNADLVPGDKLTINGNDLTAVAGAPGLNQFQIGANEAATAVNIATAINATANSFDGDVTALADSDTVIIKAVVVGSGGNAVTLSVTSAVVGALLASGATLTGGEDRPNKPSAAQAKIYRHGNVQSPSATWLDDEITDPAIDQETTQRIQVQYRLRYTAANEGINYKKHPDGFSNRNAGLSTVYAQGGRSLPVSGSSETDTAQAGGANTITLAAGGASAVNNFYNGWYVQIMNDSPAGALNQVRQITAYNGATKVATVDSAWTIQPGAASTYLLYDQSYPFVPADGSKVWASSSAAAYGVVDDGLWVAGDGSAQAAQDLGSVDGFVYAIPLCFVFRHNDASSPGTGWDPANNANGAPLYDHAGYAGAIGVVDAGKSDRPDGEFSNVITQNQLLDLRRHVIPGGLDLKAELTYQMQSLLDGSLRTWAIDTTSKYSGGLGGSSGDVSTRFLVCNEIGRATGVGGAGHSSGDATGLGVRVRNFDHVARRFGDQPVVERAVFSFYPGDRPGNVQGGAVAPGLVNPGKYVVKDESAPGVPSDADAWYEGDVLHLDLNSLNATTLGGLLQGLDGGGGSGAGLPSQNFVTFAPAGTVITDVLSIYHDDGHYTNAVDQKVQARYIKGLGTRHVEIALDANDRTVNGGDSGNLDYQMVGRDGGAAAGSPRRIFVEFEVTYPIGVGLTDTFQHEVDPDNTVYTGSGVAGPGPIVETDTTQAPNDMEALLEPRFRQGYREVMLEYAANDTVGHGALDRLPGQPIGSINTETLVSRNTTTLYFPRRINGGRNNGAVTDAVDFLARTIDVNSTEYGSSSRKLVLDPGGANGVLSGAGQTLCEIQYYAQDPIPNYGVAGGGYQVGVYFRTNAPQTAGVKEGDILSTGDGVLPTTLTVEPLAVSSDVWTGQRGVGSHDLGFPYSAPLDQIPIHDGTVTIKEWYFCATARVTVDGFEAQTGLLALHPYVQADVQNLMTFGGPANDEKPTKDAEFRAFYPFADDTAYRPTILSEPLYGATRHKVMVPILARATEDVPGVTGGILFRKNELLLVVLSRFAELDDENNVRFIDPTADNRTCAAVYRTRNLLMVVGDGN